MFVVAIASTECCENICSRVLNFESNPLGVNLERYARSSRRFDERDSDS